MSFKSAPLPCIPSLNEEGAVKSAVILIPAGAGELVQGQLHSGEDFLVTNPVACFSEVGVRMKKGVGTVTVSPHDRTKVRQAALATMRLFNIMDMDVYVSVTSSIPVGKGMASSTADIVGVVEAMAQALDYAIAPEQVSDIAISIEPSDGLMYRGIVVYNHRRGQLIEQLGPAPLMKQLVLDVGGCVDTIDFNKIPKNYTQEELDLQAYALKLVREGVKTANLVKIGQGATLSTRVNQRLLPKPELEKVLAIAQDLGAYGVACSHSGTILSLLFDPDYVLEQVHGVFQNSYQVRLNTHSVRFW